MDEIYNKISKLLNARWENSLKSHSLKLQEAMLYSLNAGGKRLRPLLAYAAWSLFSERSTRKIEELLPFLSAIEFIHTYSLIHDDLPSMDDDSLRRGKATSHIVYGEAIAILAGDALLTEAFKEMTYLSKYFDSDKVIKAIAYLSDCSGMNGMVSGQVLDIENDGTDKVTEEYLKLVNNDKTAGLIKASLVIPAILLGQETYVLEDIGEKLGLSFQLVDDVLGASKTTKELGKTANIDENKNIKTFVSIFGLEETQKRAKNFIKNAKNLISKHYKNNSLLIELADKIVNRQN